MIEQKGQRPPVKVAAQARQAAVTAIRQKYAGKKVASLKPAEQADLVLALAQLAGLADETGVIG